MKKYSDHIYYMEADPDTDQPFVFYIKGSRFHLQVDAGNSRDNYHKFLHELNEEHLPQPDLLVLTHWHWDHTFGLSAADCPVIASRKTNEILSHVQTWKWDEASMKERLRTGEDIQFTYDCMHKQYSNFNDIHVRLADMAFDGTMTIDLGDITCILEHRDSPHTRDAVFIYIPEEQVLIGGDAQYEDYYDNNSQYDKDKLQSFIDYLTSIEFKDYMKGHDTPFIAKEELLKQLKECLSAL
ncbi:MAG: MBL fold metallo-hydrolase [Solobacterium sp.]|nr:MBL fold metallo-hydrolase [Solobacterium sp.]